MECKFMKKVQINTKTSKLIPDHQFCVVRNVCCAAASYDDIYASEELNVCYDDQDGNFKIAML